MMRQAVIPAPVVVGWQGGEYGSFEDTTQVSRYNAYARAEVWFEREIGCATLLRLPWHRSAISLGSNRSPPINLVSSRTPDTQRCAFVTPTG